MAVISSASILFNALSQKSFEKHSNLSQPYRGLSDEISAVLFVTYDQKINILCNRIKHSHKLTPAKGLQAFDP